MPKQTGKPIAVIRGRFLDERLAPVSTIVVSNRRYSLCYLPTLKNATAFECFSIEAPVIKGGRIKAIEVPKLKSILDITIDSKYLNSMKPGEAEAATSNFVRALAEAQAKATKVLSQRAIRQTVLNAAARKQGSKAAILGGVKPMLIDGGGGGVTCDWDGYCTGGTGDSGGGGYWPDDVPFPDDGSGGSWEPDWGDPTAPDGSDDGGGYPFPETPDASPPITIPGPGGIPLPPIVTPGSDWQCTGAPGAQVCEGRYPRPDPNTTDPETGQRLPPSEPDRSICDYAPFSWVCGGFRPEPPHDPPPLEIIDPPVRPEPISNDPLKRDEWEERQYQLDLKECDDDRQHYEETVCWPKYSLYGGNLYDDMVEQGVKLAPGERKRHLEAKREFSVCMKKVAQEWANCRASAEAKWPK